MNKQKYLIIIVLILASISLLMFSSCSYQGLSAYEIAVEKGYDGTEEEWLESLKVPGLSAYELAVQDGFSGTEEEWLDSLKGLDGEYAGRGLSAYEIAVENGYTGTESEWLLSLIGDKGDVGNNYNTYAVNKSIMSVVSVYSEFESPSSYDYTYLGAGAGVIVEDDKDNGTAYIVTNYHVVYSADSSTGVSNNIKVYLYAMEEEQYSIDATFVGGSLTYDIAVLKIENSDIYKNSGSYPADIADYEELNVGNTAIAIGNPEASGISATEGIVSIDSEYISMTGADEITEVTFRVMRIDTAVNSGNSGGGLFNENAELIGIVNAKITSSNIENIAYAIPMSIAKNVYDNIIRNCEETENTSVVRCLIGIQLLSQDSYAHYNEINQSVEIIETIAIESVSESGIAYGTLQAGDIIKSIEYNDMTIEVNRIFTLVDYSLQFQEGETLVLNVERVGVVQSISIVLTDTTTVP